MDKPLVTVFIPLFNGEEFIRETIESVLTQTYPFIEVLIIDDGSTDNSIKIVKTFTDKRIRLLKNNTNRGIPYTRNRGLSEARGKYLAVLDADDLAFPNRIEKQLDFMEKNLDIDVLGSAYTLIRGKKSKRVKQELFTPEEIKVGLIFFNRLCNSSVMIRLDRVFKYNVIYNNDYFVAQDYDFFIQISKFGKIYILPEVLVGYRTGHSNITKRSKEKKKIKRKSIIDSIHKDIVNYYNFSLTEKEMQIFNDFFSTEMTISVEQISGLPLVLNKMKKINKVHRIFDEKLFLRLINSSVGDFLDRHNKMKLISKIIIYSKVCVKLKKPLSVKIVFLLVLKHYYRLIKRLKLN